jgi:hypothetical protein
VLSPSLSGLLSAGVAEARFRRGRAGRLGLSAAGASTVSIGFPTNSGDSIGSIAGSMLTTPINGISPARIGPRDPLRKRSPRR